MARLLVVATPIGNLNDLTPRMREALESCDLIAAEDTRVTQKLLSHFDLKKPLISCHRHNEDFRAPQLIARMLEEDLTVALTCDAGTPAISDPGHLLVRAAWEAGIPVTPICGPSAVATALSCAGFDARSFAFFGFPPREKKALCEALTVARETGIPVAVFYESPHRICALVECVGSLWPEALVCVCADLSKKFEWILRGTPETVLQALRANPNVEKGEYCLVVDFSPLPAPVPAQPAASAPAQILEQMLAGRSLEEAAEIVGARGTARNEVYRAKIAVKRFLERDDG